MNAQAQTIEGTIEETTAIGMIVEIALDKIIPDPNQPRKIFDEPALQELADDIAVHNILQPITVRPGDDEENYIIIYGERRYRAAQIAGLTVAPCIIDYSETDPADRYVSQFSENFQRANFKPIELAEFINTLNAQFGIKMKDIPDFLSEKGIKSMDRSYISNTRRLVELPDWAKDYINAGTITPSHGKYILQAKGIDIVLDAIKADLADYLTNEGTPPPIAEMPDFIEDAFNENLIDVVDPSNAIEWDRSSCLDCKTCKYIKGTKAWQRDRRYCLDETCLQQKDEAAKQAKTEALEQQKKQQQKVSKTATDDQSNDDVIASKARQSQPQPEPELSEQQQKLAEGRKEKTEQYLDRWLITKLKDHLAEDEVTRYSVLLWIAAGAPGNSYHDGGYALYQPEIDYEEKRHGIKLTLTHKIDHIALLTDIINRALESMARTNLRWLAHHCGIQLEGNYTIDKEYLEIKSKQELIDSTPDLVKERCDDWDKRIKKSAGELVEWIAQWDHLYGIPQDLQAMYLAYLPEASAETN